MGKVQMQPGPDAAKPWPRRIYKLEEMRPYLNPSHSACDVARIVGCGEDHVLITAKRLGLTLKFQQGVPIEQKLLNFSKVNVATGCREWATKSKHIFGYGKVYYQGRSRDAHRVAWLVWCGPIPAGLYVCHRCDNPSCIEPTHLFLGTNAENLSDCKQKGRNARGESCRQAKVTEDDVRNIRNRRAKGERAQALAVEYGLSYATIHDITARKTWKHVE